jgi:hypothetical protein
MPLRCCPLGHVRPYGEPCPQCGSRPHRERNTRPSLGTHKWRELARYAEKPCTACGQWKLRTEFHVCVRCTTGAIRAARNAGGRSGCESSQTARRRRAAPRRGGLEPQPLNRGTRPLGCCETVPMGEERERPPDPGGPTGGGAPSGDPDYHLHTELAEGTKRLARHPREEAHAWRRNYARARRRQPR